MSHEIAGIASTILLSAIVIWLAALAWAVTDIIRSKKGVKWLVLQVIPIAGAAAYYFYGYDTGTAKKEKAIRLAKSRWTIAAIAAIIILGVYVRLIDYRWAYLRNIDSYVFYRWIDEIVLNNGVLPGHDIYQLAPDGFFRPSEWIYPYFYLGAYSYMLVSKLVSITVQDFLIYFPPFLAAISAIPIYFIGKTLYDRKAGVLAAIFYVFDISNLSRSLGGDPDSDAIIILVSMAAMAFLIFTYKYSTTAKSLDKKLVLYSVLTAVVLWIWYSTWAGYWYIFWLFTSFIALKVFVNIIQARKIMPGILASKYIIASFAIYMVLSFLLTVPLYGTDKITSALAGPIQFQSIKGEDFQFPNVYVSVAELQQSGGPREIIERTSVLGGPAILISPFFLMIYALIYLVFSYYRTRKHLDTALLLLVWFLGPFAATIVAVRFSILFSAPLAIGSAILLSKIIRMASGEDRSFGD